MVAERVLVRVNSQCVLTPLRKSVSSSCAATADSASASRWTAEASMLSKPRLRRLARWTGHAAFNLALPRVVSFAMLLRPSAELPRLVTKPRDKRTIPAPWDHYGLSPWGLLSARARLRRPREVTDSFRNTLCRWYSTVLELMKSWAAMSALDSPSAASLATWAS